MNLEVLATQIESYRTRLAELCELGPMAVEPTELLDRMTAVLKDLDAAHVELRAQETRLAEARGELDALRRALVVVLEDVTERRVREEALEKTCQELEARLDAEIARGRLLEEYGKQGPARVRRVK